MTLNFVLGINGVEEIIELHLTEEEQKEFNTSVKALKDNYELALAL